MKTPACPEVDFINVLAPEVFKGKTLRALASHLGISLAEVVAIGDGENEKAMTMEIVLDSEVVRNCWDSYFDGC